MRRRIMLIALLLVAGAIVNVAVAWGCATQVRLKWPTVEYPEAPPQHLAKLVPDAWLTKGPQTSFIMLSYAESEAIGVSIMQLGVMEAIAGAHKLGPDRVLHVHQAGFPCRSLGCEGFLDWWIVVPPSQQQRKPQHWQGGIVAPAFLHAESAPWMMFGQYANPLPLRPIWSGFAINTVFYAAVLWLMCVFPFALRRRSRIRRGLCPACAYPVGTSEVCTECGAAVIKS